MKDELIIVNHIGTSVEKVIDEELSLLVKDINEATHSKTILAFSSQRAIDKLEKKNICIEHIHDSILTAMGNYNVIKVLPTHLVGGGDYQRVKDFCEHASKDLNVGDFNSDIMLVESLLTLGKNVKNLAKIISELIEEENTYIMFVGHGTSHQSKEYYDHFIHEYKKISKDVYFVSLDTHIAKILPNLPDKVVLFPLFTVNGHHIQKDIFQGDKSIYRQLVDQGIQVYQYNKGLLSYDKVRKLYVESILNN